MEINPTSAYAGGNISMGEKIANESERTNLDKDDFLKLLMTQLQHQDPLSPMESADMMAQMAQLSTVEQITNMSSTMEKLSDALLGSKVEQGAGMLDKNIVAVNGEGQEVSGKITKVQFNDGVMELLVNGQSLQPNQIKEMTL